MKSDEHETPSEQEADRRPHPAPGGLDVHAVVGVAEVTGALVTAGIGWMAATVFQEALQRAASDGYDSARSFFTSLRTRLTRTESEGEVELIVVQSEDGQWELKLPGNLGHDAHAALVRDFERIVREGERDGRPFTISWLGDRWIRRSH
ncbi:hypothetical protein [Streptomyces omiyaensis]|uniref:hypothetical protein n=1 Tax=Streptomyces omiyaensis TaxID=68247 RepID=UPI003701B497